MENDSTKPEVTVVLPALNEEEALPGLLKELKLALASIPHEILLVDDGSSDRTADVSKEHGVRVIRHPYSKGNGAAVKRGIREARGKTIVLMDGDGQHNPADLQQLLQAGLTHDMAVGARSKGTRQALHRFLANRLFSFLASYLAGEDVPDLTSGFRVLRADLAKRYVDLLPNSFSYPSTLTVTLSRAGYTICHVPIVARKRLGTSKIRLLADGIRFLQILLKVGVGLVPLRVFFPVSLFLFLSGLGWYGYTFFAYQRFTNMSALLLCTSIIIFMMGLVAEQIAQLRRERRDE